MSSRPIDPVKPVSMELVFFYACPFCNNEMPVVSPISPTMLNCDVCRQRFPIVPVDEHSVQFIKLMLQDGQAAIDTDYM